MNCVVTAELICTYKSQVFSLCGSFKMAGAPIAQLGERQTLDHNVVGLILTRGAVLCP